MTLRALFLAMVCCAWSSLAAPRPNIILILADDMGFSDLGCYGGEIHTPNLDRLASRGLRFTQFYNAARCCPTRAALLSGLYPQQAGVGHMTTDEGRAAYRGHLTDNTVTLAEVLGEAGYQTAMVGKWHLSITTELTNHLQNLNNQRIRESFADPKTSPLARGFQDFYGVLWGVVNYFDPFSLVENDRAVRSVPKNFYLTDALTDHALEYLDRFKRAGKPFFLYAAYTAPHWPLHALPEDIANYKDTYKVGWDAIRERRYRRMVDLGIISPDQAILSPRHRADLAWEESGDQEFAAATMAAHAAMVDRLDQNIGRIVHKLETLKLLDNTVIVFLSDNGASPELPGAGGFDRPTETRDGRPIIYNKQLQATHTAPGPQTTFGALGPMWANAANTPFRFWKKETFEGGICTPFIVHWPKGMSARPGSITTHTAHVIDLMPTFAALAGAKYPGHFRGQPVTPFEGKNLLPVLEGKTLGKRGPLFWEHYGARAVRQDQWKLVARDGEPWELYDLEEDRTEMRNLAGKRPEVLANLSKAWVQWADRCHVVLPEKSGAR
jgi:arylsulfatase